MDLALGNPNLTSAELPTYANVVHVSSTPFDFRLTFSLLLTPHDQPRSDGFVASESPRAVAEVIMPAAAVHSLLELVRNELAVFTERFDEPRPALLQTAQ